MALPSLLEKISGKKIQQERISKITPELAKHLREHGVTDLEQFEPMGELLSRYPVAGGFCGIYRYYRIKKILKNDHRCAIVVLKWREKCQPDEVLFSIDGDEGESIVMIAKGRATGCEMQHVAPLLKELAKDLV